MLRTLVLIAVAGGVLGTEHAAWGQRASVGFYRPGIPAGVESIRYTSATRDGGRVVGLASIDQATDLLAEWTPDNGLVLRAPLNGTDLYSVSAVSAIGGVVAGTAAGSTGFGEPMIWSLDREPQLLGTLPARNQYTVGGLSGDGRVVVGSAFRYITSPPQQQGEAFRWTEQSGYVRLPGVPGYSSYSEPTGTNFDGSVIVGWAWNSNAFATGYRWTEEEGYTTYPGVQHIWGASSNGEWMIGTGGNASLIHANGDITSLSRPSGAQTVFPRSVNDSGEYVVGSFSTFGLGDAAYIWTPQTGGIALSDYLTGLGITLPGNFPLSAADWISADGSTIGGRSRIPGGGGREEGFIVVIPAPSGLAALVVGAALTVRRRR